MKFLLIRIALGLIWILSAYKWGDWRNIRKYYPTLLFFGMGDLIYHVVFWNKPLWRFQTNFLVPSLTELLVIFAIFFPTTLIFLSRYPKKPLHQIMYIIFWVLLYTGIEIFTGKLGMIKSYNGWNIWWSIFHNVIQFPLLELHHKRPAVAWAIALAFLFIVMHIFRVPFVLKQG